MSEARAWLPTVCPDCGDETTEWRWADEEPGPVSCRCDDCLLAGTHPRLHPYMARYLSRPRYQPDELTLPQSEHRWTPELLPGGRSALLADVVGSYVADRRARGEIGANSARQLAWRLGMLVKACPAGLTVGDLDAGHLRGFQRHVGAQRPSSRRSYQSTVKVFCAWAVEEGLLEVDPTARLAKVKEPRAIPRALSEGQMARLWPVLPDLEAVLVVTLEYRLGLRCVEVSNLAGGDYDQAAATLHIRGKAGHERMLPVPADVAALLDAFLAGRDAGPVIGRTPNRISELVSGWMAAAGLKTGSHDGVSAHALRHTAASNLLEQSRNIRMVQQFLGHASLVTTDRYLRRANLDDMRHALEGE